MPYSRITTNFLLKKESAFIDDFHKIMLSTLKIPENDRLIALFQKPEGFYQPPNYTENYIVFEISLFAGRTMQTKRKLYKELIALASSFGGENCRANIILIEVEKDNWGVERGVPASEIDLRFDVNV